MTRLLTGPLCGWPASRLVLMDNQSSGSEVHDRLITAFEQVSDVALFYYVGHGQREEDELCLALSRTRTEFSRRSATSITFSAVRQALLTSHAATKIVVLDCCFSGAATQPHNSLSGTSAVAEESLSTMVVEQAYGTGAYTMAAAGAYGTAQYETAGPRPETYFTKYLADLVERGMPGKPAVLNLEPLFLQLRDDLSSSRLPTPERRNINSGGDFTFAYNAAPPDDQRSRGPDRLRRQAAGGDGAAASPGRREAPGHPVPRPARRPAVLVSTVVAVAVLAAASVWLLAADPFADRASADYSFGQHRYRDGLVVSRRWTVAGHDGSRFTETMSVSTATGSAQSVTFEEPVPSAAIAGLASARFTPARPKIIGSGRVLEWQLRLPATGSITAGYQAAIPAGAISRIRLQGWASQFRRQASTLPPPGPRSLAREAPHLRSLAIHPPSVHLTVGSKQHLVLSGVLGSGRRASASELSEATWRSGDPSVARVSSSGDVTAVRAGTARITARLGAVSVHIYITVAAGAAHGASGGPTPQPGRAGSTGSPEPTPTVTTVTPPPI